MAEKRNQTSELDIVFNFYSYNNKPSASNSLASLRAREEEISGAWAAGTITSNIASLRAA